MNRFLIGLGLMAALLGIGLYSAHAISRDQTPIAQALEEAAALTDREKATQLFKQAMDAWDTNHCATAVLTDHQPMDEIDGLFAQAQAYANEKQWEDFSALCLRISRLVHAIAESHQGTWWNFL